MIVDQTKFNSKMNNKRSPKFGIGCAIRLIRTFSVPKNNKTFFLGIGSLHRFGELIATKSCRTADIRKRLTAILVGLYVSIGRTTPALVDLLDSRVGLSFRAGEKSNVNFIACSLLVSTDLLATKRQNHYGSCITPFKTQIRWGVEHSSYVDFFVTDVRCNRFFACRR